MMKKTMMKLTVLVCVLGLAACSNPAGGGGGGGDGPLPDLWDGSIAAGFAGGTGDSGDPYVISSSAQLAYLAQQVNDEGVDYTGVYFTLTADLNLNDIEWTAIGTDTNRFKGVFDGVGHVISGLVITNPTADYQGLFGYLEDAEISNLGLEGVSIEGKNHVGGIAGAVRNSSIDNCYSTGNVTGTGGSGGIVGSMYGHDSIKNCYSTGDVSGTGYGVGGIAGYVSSFGSIDNCYSTGDVSGTSNYVGGIVGMVISGSSGGYTNSIGNCYSTGDVSGENGVGGIAGEVSGGTTIDNCYSTGDVSGENGVGGIAGYVTEPFYGNRIDNCYSTGDVSGTDRIGGIAGMVSSSAYGNRIDNCAALNLAVTATTSEAGRVVGSINGTNTITGNVAWEGMGNGGVPFTTGDDYDGTLKPKTAFHSETGFPFDVNTDTDPWTYTTGRLPILKNLGEQQDDALPEHLVVE
jgi:hypothetical protein